MPRASERLTPQQAFEQALRHELWERAQAELDEVTLGQRPPSP